MCREFQRQEVEGTKKVSEADEQENKSMCESYNDKNYQQEEDRISK